MIHTQYCSDLLRSLIYKPCMFLCLDQSLKFWIAFIICVFPAFNDVMLMFGGGVINVKHTRFTSPHTELVPDHIPANISYPGPQLYQDGLGLGVRVSKVRVRVGKGGMVEPVSHRKQEWHAPSTPRTSPHPGPNKADGSAGASCHAGPVTSRGHNHPFLGGVQIYFFVFFCFFRKMK